MPFLEDYQNLVTQFTEENNFFSVQCVNGPIIWPNGSGVYVIWKFTDDNIDNLIYVGATGTFRRNRVGNIVFGGGNFSLRSERWTPYKFCETPDCGDYIYNFRFGPNYGQNQRANQILVDAYQFSIPYQDLLIHCFSITSDHLIYAPTSLESRLLTIYLKEMNNQHLPPANNKL